MERINTIFRFWIILVLVYLLLANCDNQSPYRETALSVPGLIEAECYDNGGEGISYHDTSSGNLTGAYRNDDVDIIDNFEGGYSISSIETGEWLEYTVEVMAGNYYIETSISSALGGGSFHIELDGEDITGKIYFARTGGFQDWATLRIGPVSFSGGRKIMRVCMNARTFNVDWFRFVSTQDAPETGALPLKVTSSSPILATVPWLHTEGKWLKDPVGNKVVLYGVAIPDLESIYSDAQNPPESRRNKSVFEIIDMLSDKSQGWYSCVVRFVIHPKPFGDETNDHPGWLGTEPDFYFNEILDPAVMHAVKRGLYVVLDWHYVYANCESEEIINTTNDFWNYIAPRYANLANVIFDIINEPGTPGDWNSYQPIAQKWVDLIRFHAPLNLILIGGPNYARVLPMPRPSNPEELINPIEANNIIYVCHIYPGVQPNQSASSWEQLFGGLADVAPLMISEWGWEYLAPSPCTGLKSTWGAPFKEYVDSKENVGWIAWIFDQFWRPVMFDENWNLLGGDEYMGESIKQWLYEKKDVYHFQME